MTAMVFRETGVGHMYSWGNWFAEKELNGSGATARTCGRSARTG
jgi:phage portal protein BeeE